MKKLLQLHLAAMLALAPLALAQAAPQTMSAGPAYGGDAAYRIDQAFQRGDQNFGQLFNQLRPVPAYVGPIANGTGVPNTLNNGLHFANVVTRFDAKDNMQAVAFRIPCFYVATANLGAEEQPMGNPYTITGSVEYPKGVLDAQITFAGSGTVTLGGKTLTTGGSATGTCPDGGILTTDYVPLPTTIPNGARAYVHWFINAPAPGGLIFQGLGTDTENGDVFAYSFGAQSDLTMPLTVGGPMQVPTPPNPVWAGSGQEFWPLEILGLTTNQSFGVIGDSRAAGQGDPANDATGDRGDIARSLSPLAATVHASVSGDRIHSFVASHANRLVPLLDASKIIIEMDINDIVGGAGTVSSVEADNVTTRGYFPTSTPVYLTTNEPDSAPTAVAISGVSVAGTDLTFTAPSALPIMLDEVITIAGATGPCKVETVAATTVVCRSPTATATGATSYTDGLQTVFNQTPATSFATLVTLNERKRRGIVSGFAGTLDIAAAVEDSPIDGKWAVHEVGSAIDSGLRLLLTAAQTVDGVHANWNGTARIKNSRAISAVTVGP